MVSDQVEHVLERLSSVVADVRARSMFGGTGLYAGDVFFGLVSGDVLYLKVDDASRGAYVERGMSPFQPFPDKPSMQSYYELPPDVLDDPRALKAWVARALVAARETAVKKGPRKKISPKKGSPKRSPARVGPMRKGPPPSARRGKRG